jgi:GDP-4-dehydro-6-deoxy-D-mannose reductase
MTRRSIVITGATGFVGAHLTRRLQRNTPSSSAPAADAPEIHGWSSRSVNLLNAAVVDEAIKRARPDEVYHLAGASHVGESWERSTEHLEIHVRGTHHLLEAIRRHAPACRVIVVSSGMVYRPQPEPVTESSPIGPASPYALSKVAEEQLALHARQQDGLQVIIARPFNHIGPGQSDRFAPPNFAKQIAEIEAGAAPTITIGNLDTRRDFTDVRDVVNAYVAMMSGGSAGDIYNVCSGVATPIRAILDELLSMARVAVSLETDPGRLRPNDVPFMAGSAAHLTADTGWRPERTLRQTLTDTLNDWRARVARR